MNELLRFGEALFAWVLQTSWQAGILALFIILAQTLFRRWLSPAWRYGLWLLLVLRLLLPDTPQTSWSIYNVAKLPAALNRAEEPPGVENSASKFFPSLLTRQDKSELDSTSTAHRITEQPVPIPSTRTPPRG